jgi:diguanylate cyclase (GGDEF)-like protein
MLAESVYVGIVLLVAFRLRSIFGPSLVFIIFGIVFEYASLLAEDFYIPLTSWLIVSPGCVVLLPGVLLFVLVVYLTSDAVEARRLIYGVSGANILLLPLGLIAAQQLVTGGVLNPDHLAPALFTSQPHVVISSAIVLFLDTMLVVFLYEVASRVTNSLFVRIALTMVATLTFDSVAFVSATQFGVSAYGDIILSQIIGKAITTLIYTSIAVGYFRWFGATDSVLMKEMRTMSTMLRIFTYRQRYEELQRAVVRDALTDVYNRRFFDEALERQIEMANRSVRPLCLLLIDVDNFKRVNDAYGHVEGDAVLALIARALVASLRVSDDVCRYGGEEFAILLPQTDPVAAADLCERIRANVPAACANGWTGAGATAITVTIGVANYPVDANNARDLVRVADRRLYLGKAAGRNRVVMSDPPETEAFGTAPREIRTSS